jgi:hypothetical protein
MAAPIGGANWELLLSCTERPSGPPKKTKKQKPTKKALIGIFLLDKKFDFFISYNINIK